MSASLRLRRSSSGGAWEQRDGWDSLSATTESEPPESELSEEEALPVRRRSAPTRPTLFSDQPDLTPLIDTNFASQPPSHFSCPPREGFDFGGLVERAYMEHEPPSPSTYASPSSPSAAASPSGPQLRRSPSSGDAAPLLSPDRSSAAGTPPTPDWETSVWALELRGNLIAAGRSSGKLEVRQTSVSLLQFWALRASRLMRANEGGSCCSWLQLWDAVEGALRCSNEDGASGITALAFLNNR